MDISHWWFPRESGISSVTDFGCGTGGYVKMLSYSGLYARGFDGNPKTGQLDVSGGLCKGPVDLRQGHFINDARKIFSPTGYH